LRLRGSDHVSSDDAWLNFRCTLQFAARGIGRNIRAGIVFRAVSIIIERSASTSVRLSVNIV